MQYVGIQKQQSRNNRLSLLLLVLFPVLVLVLLFAFFVVFGYFGAHQASAEFDFSYVMPAFIESVPWTIGIVLVWFLIAYFANTGIIARATHSRSLSRKDNKRVYNLVENLCMSQGMTMPKVNVIDDDSLNAFASGINAKTYAVTLTTGIIRKLNDQELEAVIAHELSHIRNRDVRLLIVSIVFVGIFSMIAQMSLRMIFHMPRGRDKNGGAVILLILAVAALAALGYLFSSMMRFAISRKREYLADAGAAEMTKNPMALASALRAISADSEVEVITREDVAQLFIEHPSKKRKKSNPLSALFQTHPPIEKRIQVLEQF